MRFFVEVRRRGVLKVAVAYLGVSWLALEIGHTLFLIFELPHMGLQLIFALLTVGFPLALLGAWLGWFDGMLPQAETAHAAPTEHPGGAPAHGSGHEGAWHAAVFGLLVVVVIAIAVAMRFFGMAQSGHDAERAGVPAAAEAGHPAAGASAPAPGGAAFTPPAHSIAVLPFANMSGDPRQEYFSDGLTEELLNSLTSVPQLRVAARTSSFSFKGKDTSLGEIARALNVGAVLEGSVRRDGLHVRITAQLIDALSGYHLWSQTYDRDLKNVLALQTEIATAVSGALQASLLKENTVRMETGGTQNPEALDAYLLGKALDRAGSDEKNVRTRRDSYARAVAIDPGFARAYVGLGIAQQVYASNFLTDTNAVQGGFARARATVEKAISLAPDLGEAHAALAAVLDRGYLDSRGALHEFERALVLAPNDPQVLLAAGWFLASKGRGEAGLAHIRRAVQLDPLNAAVHRQFSYALQDTHDYRESIAEARRALSFSPNDGRLIAQIGMAYINLGDLAQAQQSCEAADADWGRYTCLAIVYHRLGRRDEAQSQLAVLQKEFGASAAAQMIEIYAQWGDIPHALQWLETAYRVKDSGLTAIATNALFDPLRGQPRFQQIARALALDS